MLDHKWAIYCPGPSLSQYQDSMFQEALWRNTIAVNGAVLKVPSKYWLVMDHTALKRIRETDLGYCWHIFTILCPKGLRQSCIQDHDEESAAFLSEVPCEHFPGNADFADELLPFIQHREIKRLLWHTYSMCAAIGMAIYKGAQHVVIFGADLAGSGYYDSALDDKHNRHDQTRWDEEKTILHQIQESCAAAGITVERKMP